MPESIFALGPLALSGFLSTPPHGSQLDLVPRFRPGGGLRGLCAGRLAALRRAGADQGECPSLGPRQGAGELPEASGFFWRDLHAGCSMYQLPKIWQFHQNSKPPSLAAWPGVTEKMSTTIRLQEVRIPFGKVSSLLVESSIFLKGTTIYGNVKSRTFKLEHKI